MSQRPSESRKLRHRQRGAGRGLIFTGLCVVGAGVVAGYIYFAKTRVLPNEPIPEAPPATEETPATDAPPATEAAPAEPTEPASAAAEPVTQPASVTAPAESSLAPAAAKPVAEAVKKSLPPKVSYAPERVVFRYNGVDSHYNRVAYVDPKKPSEPTFVDQLICEVVYVAAGRGICLNADRGVVTTYSARLFDANTFTAGESFPLKGIPSRSRISRDGKYAAYTVFVTGHGYTALDFSTLTMILDAQTGAEIADVETFAVTRKGKPFKEADFNFWGVTFTPDARDFYATLSTGGQHFLIKGNIAKRTATVIHENVECPSLSPDGTRVAYKKRFNIDNRIVWELHVLDLATDKETQLSERRSIDDQLEWLDESNVLYSVPETDNDTSVSTNVWVTRADGKGEPRLFLRRAYSPAAVRHFP